MVRSKRYYEKYSMPPLGIQYKAGYELFNDQKQFTRRTRKGASVIVTYNPYPKGTMQAKEWERGYNRAYFDKLKELETIR